MLGNKSKGIIYILPALLGYLALYFVPFLIGLDHSMRENIFSNKFVGIDNYVGILEKQSFLLAFKNTVAFMAVGIPLIMLLSLILAYFVSKLENGKIKWMFIIPIVVPSAAVTGFFLKLFGTEYLNILNSDFSFIVLITIFVWKYLGYNFIIFLTGFKMLDKSVLEAADIEGAGEMNKLFKVVLPMLGNYTVFGLLIAIINSFGVFKEIYYMQGAYPTESLYLIQHYLNNTFDKLNFNYMATASNYTFIIASICGFMLIALDMRNRRRMGEL